MGFTGTCGFYPRPTLVQFTGGLVSQSGSSPPFLEATLQHVPAAAMPVVADSNYFRCATLIKSDEKLPVQRISGRLLPLTETVSQMLHADGIAQS
ncbi:hypothetical protein HPB48_001983 [Haemaphysalis longicornis]|uniref:Uncharacterized protein n=1 Tax=Haemaphysalis longicornis TaxID=44386 RepID=A0A9J6G7N6_HAELO|nr:hypothetical protein HPB48_001983 [Haemaphysalis longicornis]